MAKLISQDHEVCQIIKTDFQKRFLVNEDECWQMLFGPNSLLDNSTQVVKIGVELDPDTLDNLRFTGYLYNPITGNVDSAGSCTFKVFKVVKIGWQDSLLASFSGVLQFNNYFYTSQLLTGFLPTEFDGGTTLMIEVELLRLGKIFRDRIYVNHLGIYDSFIRLKQEVEFLDITKQDE